MVKRLHTLVWTFFVFLVLFANGCTFIFHKGTRSDTEKINYLKNEMDELGRAHTELQKRLKDEIQDKEVKVERLEKGLVITFVAEVLFDSGKSELRRESFPKLDKVAKAMQTVVPDLTIGIEGHTDNVPIKKSNWTSNWDLSAARAKSVLDYLIERQIDGQRLSFTGFGEYRPVTTNDTTVGRQKNRRVEIVILPKTFQAKPQESNP